MDLTIIVPVYNVAKYLPECLSSLPREAKVVLVNDGSTDSSEDICRIYTDSNPNSVLINKENGGLSDARNVGMQYVNTKYVFFLDSDDRVEGKSLTEAFKYTENENLDWVQCGYAYDYPQRLVIYRNSKVNRHIEKNEAIRQLLGNEFIKNFAWGKIYKTELIRHIPFPNGKYFEDSFWQYQIIHKAKSFGIFPEIVTYYRCRHESISGKFSWRNMDLVEGLKKRFDFIYSTYPEYAPLAAKSLWETLSEFSKIASCTQAGLADAMKKEYTQFLAENNKLIIRGILEAPRIYRIPYLLRLANGRLPKQMGEFMIRVIKRLSSDSLTSIHKTYD